MTEIAVANAEALAAKFLHDASFYRNVRTIAAMPDVAMAMQSCIIAIKEGGVEFQENGMSVSKERESLFYNLLDAILRSILMFNACAITIEAQMEPRVLNPGVDGVFKFCEKSGQRGTVQWIPKGRNAPDPKVSVSWFNPVNDELQMISCVSFLSAAASQWEEFSANYLEGDFALSHTSYGLVLRNAGLITSESTALRGAPTDARFAVSNVVAMQAKAQMTGRAPDTTALTEKMAALTDAVRSHAPIGRVVRRFTTTVNGTPSDVQRVVPGTVASPLAPGFATESASQIARNPHFLEIRTNMWLLPIAAAFGIPPTRLFGFRGPWDNGNLSRSSANMQVEANYRNRISNFRTLVERVFTDISNLGRPTAIGTDASWLTVPLPLRIAASSKSPDNLLAPYARYMKLSGSFRSGAELASPDRPEVDKESEWTAMLKILSMEIQRDALSKNVVLETGPILDYLQSTSGRDYDAWIRNFSKQHPKSAMVDDVLPSVLPTDEDKPGNDDPDKTEGTASEPETPEETPALYEIVWRREPGLAQMLMTMIDGNYVDQTEAMRIILPELGFRDKDEIERLLKGAPAAKRQKVSDPAELEKVRSVPEGARHFEGPPQDVDSNA